MEILCFFAGTAFFYLKNPYPLFLLCGAFIFRPKIVLFFWFLAAIFWSFFHQFLINDQGMPHTNLILKATLQGTVSSIPTLSPNRTQFQFLAEKLDGKPIKANLLLSCYDQCPAIHTGQQWLLQAKLKKPMNLSNPGGFDYVALLCSRHIQWVGNVYHHSFKPIETKTQRFP